MVATSIPPEPKFAHESERLVWDALRRKLRDCDVLLSGLRFMESLLQRQLRCRQRVRSPAHRSPLDY